MAGKTKRIAVVGGGVAGLTAAYELEKRRRGGEPLDWHLYEASERFGGTVQTTRHTTEEGEWILEGGPDGWVTEKPWARALAVELGLGDQLIPSRDADKKTYLWTGRELVVMPDRLRMMVPEDLGALETSPLFSPEAKAAYAHELARAAELKEESPREDESVASFVLRHFGSEVLEKIGAPLLSGIFGGDVRKLSVQAVMPTFKRMEAEHGSLIKALQIAREERGDRPPQPTFTTLKRGMGTLVEALLAALPQERLHTGIKAVKLRRTSQEGWLLQFAASDAASCAIGFVDFQHVFLATPGDVARDLLAPLDPALAALLPAEASSAVLATFCWAREAARSLLVPPGFGFLVPAGKPDVEGHPRLLAGTFTTQKFTDRAPAGAQVIRAFFGGEMARVLQGEADQVIIDEAWSGLQAVLPGLPAPQATLTTVARWPRSLPQYEVGHLERMQQLQKRSAALGHLALLGNGYHGVGVPDLVRDAQSAARQLTD